MKAAVIRASDQGKKLMYEEVPEPTYGPKEVLVRVSSVGICGSDLHGFLDPAGKARPPGLIMGHEASGVVAATGSDVDGVAVGDRVTIDPQVTCGSCWPCSQGWISICDHKLVIGSSLYGMVQGAMAELVAVSERQVVGIPGTVTLQQAALIEPLANALHVVTRCDPSPHDVVVVLGAGPLGLCVLQCLRAVGAGTIAISDVIASRRELASTLGADIVINPASENLGKVILELTDGRGADLVIEAVGIDVTYQQAVQIVRKRGRVACFGAIKDLVQLPLMRILHKEIELLGCTGANDETRRAVDLVAQKRVDISALVTHSFDLSTAAAAFETLADPGSGAIKVLVGASS